MSKYKIKDWTDADCDIVEAVFDKLHGKYTLLIVSLFALDGEKSFRQIQRELKCINSKTLTERLHHLVESKIIKNRRVTKGKVKKSYYSINKGEKEFLDLIKSFRSYARSLKK